MPTAAKSSGVLDAHVSRPLGSIDKFRIQRDLAQIGGEILAGVQPRVFRIEIPDTGLDQPVRAGHRRQLEFETGDLRLRGVARDWRNAVIDLDLQVFVIGEEHRAIEPEPFVGPQPLEPEFVYLGTLRLE